MDYATRFLMENGNVAIRYRTYLELVKIKEKETIKKLEKELYESKLYKKRLENLNNDSKVHDFNGIHGATKYHLENSIPMILDLGIKRGFGDFDEAMIPIIERLEKKVFLEEHVFYKFPDIIILPFLMRAGYKEEITKGFLRERIDIIHSFIKEKNYDIYDYDNTYGGIPKNFKKRRIIKPELYKLGDFKIPLIYDIYAFSIVFEELEKEDKNKVEEIVEYILDEKYQEFDNGYGILFNGNNRYLIMGWDCKLPKLEEEITSEVINFMEWFISFESFRSSIWFKKAFDLMMRYEIKEGIFKFPKESLVEKNGAWIKSNHMSLGESRRKKNWIEVESTFRANKILKKLNKELI